MNYLEKISNEEVNELPLIEFQGNIHLVESEEDLEKACEHLKNFTLLGFDTEAKPSFKKGIINPVSLLQLATSDDVFLIRLQKCGFSLKLKKILEKPAIIKTGVAIDDDLKDLKKLRNFKPGGFIALEKEVKKIGIESNGLRKLAGIILKRRISKGAQVSNWEAPELSDKQKVYAATDAWISLIMMRKIQENYPTLYPY